MSGDAMYNVFKSLTTDEELQALVHHPTQGHPMLKEYTLKVTCEVGGDNEAHCDDKIAVLVRPTPPSTIHSPLLRLCRLVKLD